MENLYSFKVRCSSLSDIIGLPKSKADQEAGKLTNTAKEAVRKIAKFDLFGYQSFEGNRQTQKGNDLEEMAIKLSGLRRGLALKKNTERKAFGFISGECDIYVPSRRLIIDTKCSWDIGTHPFFQDEAAEKAKKMGYDIQMQGYMLLWDCEEAQIDFVLLPTPLNLIASYEDNAKLIDLVEQIPQEKRITTLTIKRDDEIISRIMERCEAANRYYQQLIKEMI